MIIQKKLKKIQENNIIDINKSTTAINKINENINDNSQIINKNLESITTEL